ncbi:hypothetical protein BC938DRAFT_470729 [Jimgerdemannia flammicorona]|uniref:Uncharacterized protein n=1 Tax=Jimgerdemannia flammicorona TaxID=994334 RepID=A0A433Q9M3_9FUNG|nr:hypothetical protein BC938DRAFT_470729 [Jimgerdemannia flammicorona]
MLYALGTASGARAHVEHFRNRSLGVLCCYHLACERVPRLPAIHYVPHHARLIEPLILDQQFWRGHVDLLFLRSQNLPRVQGRCLGPHTIPAWCPVPPWRRGVVARGPTLVFPDLG